jgi:hypothetical protein
MSADENISRGIFVRYTSGLSTVAAVRRDLIIHGFFEKSENGNVQRKFWVLFRCSFTLCFRNRYKKLEKVLFLTEIL